MKIKEGFMLREVAGSYVVVAVGFVVPDGLEVAPGFGVPVDFGVGEEVEEPAFTTLILQVSFFLPTLAVMVVLPVFFAVTTPFFETVATFFLLLFQVTFFFVFFTFSFNLLPTFNVALVLLSLTFFFRNALLANRSPATSRAANMQIMERLKILFFI